MACANCHGFDGQGKPEGGITPSNLTWEVLSKPYGLHTPMVASIRPTPNAACSWRLLADWIRAATNCRT